MSENQFGLEQARPWQYPNVLHSSVLTSYGYREDALAEKYTASIIDDLLRGLDKGAEVISNADAIQGHADREFGVKLPEGLAGLLVVLGAIATVFLVVRKITGN